MATFTVADKTQIKEHDDFINGVAPSGKDGAKSRLSMIEETLLRRDKASNYLIGASISVIVGIILWLIKDVFPALINNANLMSMAIK
jgi:hypothetical protein